MLRSSSIDANLRAERRPLAAALTPTRILVGMVLLYFVVLTAGMAFKWTLWGQGFDHVDYEQAIWNTTQGRPFQISRYNFTDSILGMDWMPGLLFAVPFYALWPSAYMLDILQSALLALGAVPVYLIARDQFGSSEKAGLAWAATYLLFPTLQFVNMTPPWQPRTLAILCLLWAFRFFQQRRLWPFLLMLVVAITTRTDVSLVVIAWGMYAAPQRRSWRWWLPPLLLGFAWFYVSTSIITPSFYHAGYNPNEGRVDFDPSKGQQAEAWPGKSAQLGYYAHLGKDPVDIVKNILTHPVETFNLMFTGEKLWYLFLMFGTLLFLPLLAPDVLLLCAPIFLINLLSTRVYQYTIEEQYQALIIPGIVLAGIVGAARLWGWIARRQAPTTEDRAALLRRVPLGLLLAQVLIIGSLHLPLKNPVISAFRNHERPERVALMEEISAQIPRDAKVAATSFLAPHLLPRQHLFYLPPGPMHHDVDEAEYAFIDERAAVLKEHPRLLEHLHSDPRWTLIVERDQLLLFKRQT
ncbi:MAG TPA: DUF2079 domain-containing protein [Herpetosiphonaceae bacterium]